MSGSPTSSPARSDVDKDWDTYIKNLKDSGLDKFLSIYQTAYDAKYKK